MIMIFLFKQNSNYYGMIKVIIHELSPCLYLMVPIIVKAPFMSICIYVHLCLVINLN